MHVIPSRAIVVSLHPPEDPVDLSIRPGERDESTSRRVVRIAELQGGCVTRRQLVRVGASTSAVGRLCDKGWLLPIHRGVYAVGHLPRTHEEGWWGCVLACGKDAKVSAGTSAAAHALLRPHSRVHVTTPSKRSRPGVANHTADTETVWIGGLPCTTVARTVLDLAGCVPAGVLESAVRQAQVRGVLDLRALAELTLAFPRARGVRRLRCILGDPVLLAPTRSKPERIALRALLDAGWEWPQVGKAVAGEDVDFSWPGPRLVLEIDGPTHLTPVQRARDARRDARLAALGWRIVRVADTDAARAPDALRRLVDSSRGAGRRDDSMRRGGAAA